MKWPLLDRDDRGAPDGVASLDAAGKILPAQLPDIVALDDDVAAAIVTARQRPGNNVAGPYTLGAADAGRVVNINVDTAVNLTVPTNTAVPYPLGTVIDVVQGGGGPVIIVAAGGVTLNAPGGPQLARMGARAQLVKVATNTWWLTGDTVTPGITSTTRPANPARGVRYTETDTGDVVAHDGTRWVKVGGRPRILVQQDLGANGPYVTGTLQWLGQGAPVPAHTAGLLHILAGPVFASDGLSAVAPYLMYPSGVRMDGTTQRWHNNAVVKAANAVSLEGWFDSDGSAQTARIAGSPEATALSVIGGYINVWLCARP